MIFFPIGLWTAISTQQAPQLTIEDALKIAEQNAYSLKIAESAVQKSKYLFQEADGTRKPQVRFDANYTRFDKEISGSSGTIRPIDSKTASVGLSYPLDIGGALGKVVQSAKYLFLASQDNFQAELNNLRLSVRSAYIQVTLAAEQVSVFSGALETANARLKNLEAQLKQGQVAKIDVLRAQTLVSQSESDLIRAKQSLELAKSSLNDVLSRPVDTPFLVYGLDENPTTDLNEANLIETALANRRELKSFKKQNAAFEELGKAAKAATTPTLNLAIQHSANFGALGFASTEQSTVGVLSVSFSLYDAGVAKAKIAQNKEDAKLANFRFEQAALGISLEVRQAVTNLRNSQARLDVAERQVISAKENLRLSLLRASNGEGIEIEVIDAQNQLTSALAQRITAQYDKHLAFAQLQKAVGNDELKTMGQGGKN